MLGQRPAISSTPLGRALGGLIFGIFFGVDHRHGGFDILQRQFELVRIALLRPPPEGGLFEGRNELFQAFNPLVLAPVARIRGDQHRLQCSNFFKQISGLRHGRFLPNRHGLCLWKELTESSCRSHSTASGAFASMARTRRQSSPANSASNCAWFISISPSFTAGQVKVCSSSRL